MQDEASYETKLMVWDSDISQAYYILPPFQIIRHPKNLRVKAIYQDYREKYKNL